MQRLVLQFSPFSALLLLVRQQEEHPVCKKTECWGAVVVVCLERGTDLHMAQLMPLPLTVACFSKIQIGFAFLVLAHPGSPRKGPLNGCVCVQRLTRDVSVIRMTNCDSFARCCSLLLCRPP